MPIFTLIFILVAIALIMYLVNRFIPMEQPFKNILNIAVAVAVILWLLGVFGIIGSVANTRVGR